MNGISHQQAIQLIHRRLDGMLQADQQSLLDEHLGSCDSCRAYAGEIDLLPDRLQHEFHARWDEKNGPSQNVMAQVQRQTRRAIISNRISLAMKVLVSVVAILFVGLLISAVVSQMRDRSIAIRATQISNGAIPVAPQSGERLLAFTTEQDGNDEIYTINADGSEMTNLTKDPANDDYPFWSPDGKQIAFESDRDGSIQIYLMNADGSNVTRLTEGEGDHHLDANGYSPWSPDGSRLLVSYIVRGEQISQLQVVNVADKSTTSLTKDPGEYLLDSWSADGKHIAFISTARGQAEADLYVINSDGHNPVNLTETLSAGEYFSRDYYWSQAGNSIFFATHKNEQIDQKVAYISTVYKASVDGSIEIAAQTTHSQTINWWNSAEVHFVLDETRLDWTRPDGTQSSLKLCESDGQMSGFTFERSPIGNLVFGSNCTTNGWVLYWINPDATSVSPILDSTIPSRQDSVFHFTWSADDQYLAFVSLDTTSADSAETLYILDVAKARENPSAPPLKLENSFGQDWQPIVHKETELVDESSNKGLLAFTRVVNGNREIYTIHADGTEMTNLTNDPANDSFPFWSPDGKQIAFESDRDGSIQIYLMNADGSNVTQLTDGEGIHQLDISGHSPWSPDGSRLIVSYMLPGDQTSQLQVVDIFDKSTTPLTKEPGQYLLSSWSADGTHIAFISSEIGRAAADLYVISSDGNDLVKLTESLSPGEYYSGGYGGYEWSVDDTSIFFATQKNEQVYQDAKYFSTIYRSSVDGIKEVVAQTTDRQIINWWNGGTVRLELSEGMLHWTQSDGSESQLELCQADSQIKGMIYERSHTGSVAFGLNCAPNGWTLYWLPSDGPAADPLLESTTPSSEDFVYHLTWSHDDRHLAFASMDSKSVNPTETVYILDVVSAREDPSVQPLKLENSFGQDWQPISRNEVVEEKSTPEPVTFSLTVQEAEEQAGFDVLEPSYLPEGYTFQGAAYNQPSNAVILQYGLSSDDPQKTSVIHIFQKPGDFPELGLPSESHATSVPVGDVMGELTKGAWVYDSPDTTTPRWEESDTVLSLSWQRDNMSFSVDYLGSVLLPPIEQSELVAIAEGLKPATTQQFPSIGTNISNGEWIAFIGGKTVPDPVKPTVMTTEQDVFLVHPDGSGLVNITNSPDYYVWPQWSPNGNNLLFLRSHNNVDILRKTEAAGFEVLVNTQMSFGVPFEYNWSPNSEKIAFVDQRSGNYDIYTVYADGRNDPELTQLTDDPAQDVGFVWSPDGSQIAFQRLNGDQLSIYVMKEDGSDQLEIARGTGKVTLYWSRDGKAIYASGVEGNWLECEGCVHEPGIYRINLEGSSVQQIYHEPASNQVGWYLYDSPENMLYFMRVEPQRFLQLWGTWFRFDGNSVQEIDSFDPHQTCKTTTGNTLSEDISPNQRFSIITNSCAGGFDLYLADREASELKLLHLLRLPLNTWGQGGDFAYLPITWSPDGRWLVYDDGNASMLILDLEKVMQDSNTKPIPLIQPILFEGQSGQLFQSPESISVFDLVWQPNP